MTAFCTVYEHMIDLRRGKGDGHRCLRGVSWLFLSLLGVSTFQWTGTLKTKPVFQELTWESQTALQTLLNRQPLQSTPQTHATAQPNPTPRRCFSHSTREIDLLLAAHSGGHPSSSKLCKMLSTHPDSTPLESPSSQLHIRRALRCTIRPVKRG